MAGKGDTFRPVHLPTYRENFDAIKWGNGVNPGVTIYLKRNEQVLKLPASRLRRGTYDASIDAPLKERVLGAYRKIEDEGKLSGRDAISRRGADFIKSVWNNPALDSR